MGMDFVALMKYGGPDERLSRLLGRLEAESPAEIQALAGLMQDHGMRNPDHEQAAVWQLIDRPDLRDPRLDRRPVLPNLGVSLWLPEGFSLTFGRDAALVYHLMRWHFFLTDPDLQRSMLDACFCLARLIEAADCVVTSDYSPVVQAFWRGEGFDACLASAGQEHGERPTLADLYLEIPLPEVMQLVERQGRPPQTRHMDWDVNRSPPEGWRRVTTWDSRGYWRADHQLGPVQAAIEGPNLVAEPTAQAATVADGRWWQTSGDPDAMLDHLLKQDSTEWRKILLWACACLRRIWPLLATEPVRRAVEVAERLADSDADWRAAANAAGSVSGVRKGDRRANRAACLLAELCSGTRCFPPGDVSRAVTDAVVADPDEAARAAERKAHADLLRDIFGLDPSHTPAIDPAWRTPSIFALAQAAYEERRLPSGHLDNARLAMLADALEKTGVMDQNILGHLRRKDAVHVRGCFLIDLLTGQE